MTALSVPASQTVMSPMPLGPATLAPLVVSIVGSIERILEMHAQLEDRCHRRETLLRAYQAQLTESTKVAELAHNASKQALEVAAELARAGAPEQAAEVVKEARELCLAAMSLPALATPPMLCGEVE